MSALAWVSDIHLNFVDPRIRRELYRSILETDCSGLLIGGDIAEGSNLTNYLGEIAGALPVLPIYFVLGNHDFYGSSIQLVRKSMLDLKPQLVWLTARDPIDLGQGVALIGDDGWADGRLGNYHASEVMLNDYLRIAEFIPSLRDKTARLHLLNQLGDESAARVKTKLRAACERGFRQILALTHVPPFQESCWHQGKTSDSEWLPHFSSKAIGDALVQVMDHYPGVQLTVLCGHTHSPGIARIRPNLIVKTAGAEYGSPAIQKVLELPYLPPDTSTIVPVT